MQKAKRKQKRTERTAEQGTMNNEERDGDQIGGKMPPLIYEIQVQRGTRLFVGYRQFFCSHRHYLRRKGLRLRHCCSVFGTSGSGRRPWASCRA